MIAIIVIPMLVIGAATLIAGIQARRADGPADGTVQIAIGAVLLPMALFIGFVPSLMDALASDDTPVDSQATNATPGDVSSAIRGADKYLRSINDLQLNIKAADGTQAEIVFAGDDASGQIRPRTGKIDIVRLDDETYLKPSDDFWPSASKQAAIDQIDGRWLHVAENDPVFGGLVTFADRSNALELLDERQTFTRTEGKVVDSVKCSGFKVASAGATLYISEGSYQYRLIQFVDRDGSVGTLSYEASSTTPTKPTRVVEAADIFPRSAS